MINLGFLWDTGGIEMSLELFVEKRDGETSRTLVILIHGLGAPDTWSNWKESLLSDSRLVGTDVAVAKYKTAHICYPVTPIKKTFHIPFINKTFALGKLLSIEKLAHSLKCELELEEYSQYENIILVGHSMGGLIAAWYMLNADDKEEIPSKIIGYISVATPFNGSHGAVWYSLIKGHTQVSELTPNSEFIDNLGRQMEQKQLHLMEKIAFTFIYAEDDEIVPPTSAIPRMKERWQSLSLPGGHSSVLALSDGKNSKVYRYISDRILKAVSTSKVDSLANTTNDNLNEKMEISQEIPQMAQKLDGIQNKIDYLQKGVEVIASRTIPNSVSNSSNVLITKLVQEKSISIKNLIDNGKLKTASEQLSLIMKEEGFSQLSPNDKIEYYYLNGLVLIRANKNPFVQECIDRIKELGPQSTKSDILSAKLSFVTNDEAMLTQALKDLKEKEAPQSEIDVICAGFYVAQRDNEKTINLLATPQGEIKDIYINNPHARIYLGIAYLNEKNYPLANLHFEAAYQLESLPYTKYLKCLAFLATSIGDKGKIFYVSPTEKQVIQTVYDELNSLKDYFTELDLQQNIEFWCNLLTALFYLAPNKVIDETKGLDIELLQQERIQEVLADAYSLMGNFIKAQQIYKLIYENTRNPDKLPKLLVVMFQQEQYSEIVEYAIGISILDKTGISASVIIEASARIKPYEEVVRIIKALESHNSEAATFIHSAAEVAYSNNDMDKAEAYLQKAVDLLVYDNEPMRLLLTETCLKLGHLDLAIEVLTPFIKYSESAQKQLIHILSTSDEKAKIESAENILDEILARGNTDQYYYYKRAELRFNAGDYKGALVDYEKVFEANPNEDSAYNVAVVKLRMSDISMLEVYIPYLEKGTEPRFIMMLSHINGVLKRGGSLKLAYKALHRLGNKFDERIYLGYIRLIFPPNRSHDKESIELERVENDTVVFLQNGSEINFICIDAEIGLIEHEGETSFTCKHYTANHYNAILLRGVTRGSEVVLDGTTFVVNKIMNKFVFAFQYCLNTFIKNCPKSPYLSSIQMSNDDPITPLIPMLERLRKHEQLIFEQYNNIDNGVGLPLSVFDIGLPERYAGTITNILNKPDQAFYAGPISFVDLNSKPVIVTLSSIVLLNILGKIDLLHNLNNIYIPASLVETVNRIFDKTTTEDVRSVGSIGMGEDGRPVYNQSTEESKLLITDFWRKILIELNHFHIERNIPSLRKEFYRKDILGCFDLDAISLTNNLDGILLCDDDFIRNFSKACFASLTNVNSITLINQFADTDTLFSLLVTLTKARYLYCISPEIMIKMVEVLNDSQPIIGEGTNFDKFKDIIKNLCIPSLFKIYFPIFRDTIYHLTSKPLIIPSTELVIVIIITELRNASLAHGYASNNKLLNYLLAPYEFDLHNRKYIRKLFENIYNEIVLP